MIKILAILAIVVLTGCGQGIDSAQLPTIMVLPTAGPSPTATLTSTPLPPSATPTSILFELEGTLGASDASMQTAIAPLINPTLTQLAPIINPSLTVLAPTMIALNATLLWNALPECPAETYWTSTEPMLLRFFDTAEIAGATPRNALATLIVDLASIRREFGALEAPECLLEVHRQIEGAMSNAVEGFTQFLSSSEGLAGFYFDLANEEFYAVSEVAPLALDIDVKLNLALTHLIWGGTNGEELQTPSAGT